MEGIMLVCKYGEERLAIQSDDCPTNEKLIEMISDKWDNLRYEQINLFYSTPMADRFLLKDAVDFRGMLRMTSIFNLRFVEIDVKPSTISQETSAENYNAKKKCLIVPHEVGLSSSCVLSESSYNVHSNPCSPLLSANWGMAISHVGQTFSGGRVQFRAALAKYAIDRGFSISYKRNDKRNVLAYCRNKDESTECPWLVSASVCTNNDYFVVRKLVNHHTCDARLKRVESKQLSSKLVAGLITKPMVSSKKTWVANDVSDHLKEYYGQDLDYKTAWHALEKANQDLFGNDAESYQQLWWYTRAVIALNPGSRILLELDEDTYSFQRIFIAWGACIEGFKSIRPMLFLDGTHLSGKFQGCLLSATGKTANNELYPLAYAVVDAENRDNWLWFMENLRDVVGYDRVITFVSDRCPGILESIRTFFTESTNFFCMRHLQDNIRGRYSGKQLKNYKVKMVSLFTVCARAPTVDEFARCLKEFTDEGGKVASDFLMDMPYNKWSNAYAGVGRYGEMTSNAAESFNNWIKDAKRLPITQCIDKLREKLMLWFDERRTISAKWNGYICPNMEDKLQKLISEGQTWRVRNANDYVLEVLTNQTYSVDLRNQTCSCNVWQLQGFPCSHAVAAVNSSRMYHMEDYIEDYWFLETYRQSYERTIMPITNSTKEQYIPIDDPMIIPPTTKRPSGRPKKQRFKTKGELENDKAIRCSRCNSLGHHNRKSCKIQI